MKYYFNEKSEYLPDYDFWLKCPYWTHIQPIDLAPAHGTAEAIYLLMNIEPRLFNHKSNPFLEAHSPTVLGREGYIPFLDFYETQQDISNLLERCIKNNTIEAEVDPEKHTRKIAGLLYEYCIYKIKPDSLIRWAVSENIRVAAPFLNFVDVATDEKLLSGWDDIAICLGVVPRTAQRWHKEDASMPIKRTPKGRPLAMGWELRAWLLKRKG